MAIRYTWNSIAGTYIIDDTGNYILDNSGAYILASQIAVSTDLPDYAPGSTATFTANVSAGDTVTFNVVDTTGAAVSGTNHPWTVTDGGVGDLDGIANGVIQTTWAVGQDAAGESFVLTATNLATGGVASATFTDAI